MVQKVSLIVHNERKNITTKLAWISEILGIILAHRIQISIRFQNLCVVMNAIRSFGPP